MDLAAPAYQGTRDELITELREAARGWSHFGSEHLAASAKVGADQLESGTLSSVRVGHSIYVVTE